MVSERTTQYLVYGRLTQALKRFSQMLFTQLLRSKLVFDWVLSLYGLTFRARFMNSTCSRL